MLGQFFFCPPPSSYTQRYFLELHICFHPLLPSGTDSATEKKNKTPRGLLSAGHVLACVVDAAPVCLLFGLLQANRQLRYLRRKNAKLHMCSSPKAFPGARSVAVRQLNARSFRLLSHILEFLVDVGPLFHFCPRNRQRRRSFQTKRYKTQPLFQPIATSQDRFKRRGTPLRQIIVCGPYCRNCRRYRARFFLFLRALKQTRAALLSCNSTPVSIHCCPPELIPRA